MLFLLSCIDKLTENLNFVVTIAYKMQGITHPDDNGSKIVSCHLLSATGNQSAHSLALLYWQLIKSKTVSAK